MFEVIYGFGWRDVLIGLAIFVVTFTVSLAIVSVVMVKIPKDYFQVKHPRKLWADKPPAIRYLGIAGKNLLGVALVIVGILLSLPGVPGQGFLTILLGIMLVDFPGKQKLEYKLVSRPQVRNAIDKLRQRFGKPKLVLD